VAQRLDLLGQVALESTAPAPVVVAVVHGELLTLRPFGVADGVVARAAARLASVATGLDPRSLGVPEVSWMGRSDRYRAAAAAFAAGTPDGLREWLLLCCSAIQSGAREAASIADVAA
jgi:hypothetical protein